MLMDFASYAENRRLILRMPCRDNSCPLRRIDAIISAKDAVIMRYIYDQDGWPEFTWDDETITPVLVDLRHRQGRLIGRMEGLGFDLRNEAVLTTLTNDVLKSSEIEGEHLDQAQVRSSIARRLGMDISGLVEADRNVEGVVEMMLDATQNYDKPLIKERLFDWHAALFPTGRSGMHKIIVADWRDDANGPMQVVSGPYGKEKVHFEAPEVERVDAEMEGFLAWFEGGQTLDPVLKAAIAHLYFVTIHPFADGNGRTARAIADMGLARSDASAQRFYSMSTQIRKQRKTYHDILERTQKGGLDITDWLHWFLETLNHAFDGSEEELEAVFQKSRFWDQHKKARLNDRQRVMLNRLLDGFTGKLTSSKWAKITEVSQDTANRDINDLIDQGILIKEPGGGRSTSYALSGSENDT